MGRIGKRVLVVPAGVEIKILEGRVEVTGPKGTLTQEYLPLVKMKVEDGKFYTLCESADRRAVALQGTYNALVRNMIIGVTIGFEKELELLGVGYRAQIEGKKLLLQIGFSHPVEFDPPAGIEFAVTGGNKIKVKGIDCQQVGEVAAEIRQVREVEPYKGKGIRYVGEKVRRKAGKAAKVAGAAGGA